MNLEENLQLELAYQFVELTGKNIFLTGKAGTGKTTFLHSLKKTSCKRMVVVAPTGVAAINAGGVTIHSFFQLPFGPQVPLDYDQNSNIKQNSNKQVNYQRFNRDKIDIIKSLDLLVIDEVSMVRADLLDGIDGVLRRYRDRSKPFGGVQLLMIGDLQQLAPVIKEDEWIILKNHYDTVFFFSSKALQKSDVINIELKHIYRQSEETFIRLLNRVRDNQLDENSLSELNSRYIQNFSPDDSEGYITLTTHNYQSQNINSEKLRKLKSKEFSFTAKIEGDFPENSYPTELNLVLKVGAQVMFVKNDPSHEKLFFNGKIGILENIDDDILYVRSKDDETAIEVCPLEWQNCKYTIDDETKDIRENVVGSFTQYPLKLAWAITIHKSQGLTFEKAIIDAQAAFAHGQVYVALSRCRSIDGLVLSTPIANRSIISDSNVKGFNKHLEVNQPDKVQLAKAKLDYERDLILDLFNFELLQKQIFFIIRIISENLSGFDPELIEVFRKMNSLLKTDVIDVAEKFAVQIKRTVEKDGVEGNAFLHERVTKACSYFEPKIESIILSNVEDLRIESDNRDLRKRLKDGVDKLITISAEKTVLLNSCKSGFTVKHFLELRAKASLLSPIKKKVESEKKDAMFEKVEHPEFYKRIKVWRDSKAEKLGVSVFSIIPRKAMLDVVNGLPFSKVALRNIKGLGRRKVDKFGEEIIALVKIYREEKGISTPQGDIYDDPNMQKIEKDSKRKTFDLFQSGKTVNEIAQLRGMAPSTIEGHLSFYIGTGQLSLERLVQPSKIEIITQYFQKSNDQRLGLAKATLGEDYSYNELRWVLKHLEKNIQ
jgi:hypothetical protein